MRQRRLAAFATDCAAAVVALLASGAARAEPPIAPLAGTGAAPPPPWHRVGLPLQRKPFTAFEVVALDGERVLRIEATRSYGNLVHELRGADAAGHELSWRWRVDDPLPEADLRRRGSEDVPVRVCALYDLPLAALSFVERQLLRVARAAAAHDPPGATVCYVWNSTLPPGSRLASPFTRRVRYLVLHGPEAPLRAWIGERRDLGADFLALFGDEAKQVPPLIGIAVGADADNTGGHSLAHLADLVLR